MNLLKFPIHWPIMRSLIPIVLFILSFHDAASQSQLIDVDGKKIDVKVIGIEKRKAGQPVIVFENGMGVTYDNWEPILDEVSKLAPLVLYDRPGMGKSEDDAEMPTIKNVSDKLRKLLIKLKIEPPYILVGHSMGGVYVRGYALHFPDDLAGIIMNDPADITETSEFFRLPMKDMGVSEDVIDAIQAKRMKEPAIDKNSPYKASMEEEKVLYDLRISDFKELREFSLPDIPVHFIVGGKFDVSPERQIREFDHETYFRARTRRWIERYTDLVNKVTYGKVFYSANAGHFVHRDDPTMVISSIRIALEDYAKLIRSKKE